MGRIKWAAAPVIAITLLVVAIGVALLARGDDRTTTMQSDTANTKTARQAQPSSRHAKAPVSNQQVKTPGKSAPRQAAAIKTAARPAEPVANKPARPVTKPRAASPRVEAPPNALGWRLGTEWTVRVSEYDTHKPVPAWTNAEYRYKIIASNPVQKSLTLSMRFADLSSQPESARGELVRAGYVVEDGRLQLAWVQPLGRGPRLTPEEGELLMGENALPLDIPVEPFAGGASVQVNAPRIGESRGNKVSLRDGATATYVKGAPWWVSYSEGKNLKATMTGFTR